MAPLNSLERRKNNLCVMINLLVRNDEGLLPPRDLHVLGCLHTEGEVVDLAGCSIQHAYYLNKPEAVISDSEAYNMFRKPV